MHNNVITRFAPSPTGFLHIGGARTALFNWVFAKHMQGKMLLRIEDTDKKRSNQQATDAIINGLSWLGINWDGDVISQNSRQARHQEIALKLLELGKAYKCYASSDEIKDFKESNPHGRFISPWREKEKTDIESDLPYAIRLKVPLQGETSINDQVQGKVVFPNNSLEDFVLLRADGTPTYMLAVVVDDHDMGVTHIIRGNDHLTNTAKQYLIYQAMGWDIPQFSHIPLIHGEDGAKLSKRHGALGVETYRAMGYLPMALKNYLIRLGWSHGDDEIMSMEQIIEWFSLDSINKAPSRFDFKKLNSINEYYIKNMDNNELYDILHDELEYIFPDQYRYLSAKFLLKKESILCVLKSAKQKSKTLLDLIGFLNFLLNGYELSATSKESLTAENMQHIANIKEALENISLQEWHEEFINRAIHDYLEKNKLKFPAIGKPLRTILVNGESPLPLAVILEALGKDETLTRICSEIGQITCKKS